MAHTHYPKLDALIIFFSLVISNIIYVVYDIELSHGFLDIQERTFFALSLIIFIISLSSTYDIITSLFYLNELRYEISNTTEE